VLKQYDVFAKNPRTALVAKNAERFSDEEQMLIQQSADKILNNLDHI
jgi:hypothetical protein